MLDNVVACDVPPRYWLFPFAFFGAADMALAVLLVTFILSLQLTTLSPLLPFSLVSSSATTESRLLEVESERVELTRQLSQRLAELADAQRALGETQVRERALLEKLDQSEVEAAAQEQARREETAMARQAAAERERLQAQWKSAEKEARMTAEKLEATREELAEARKQVEKGKRGGEEAKMRWRKEKEEMDQEMESLRQKKEEAEDEWRSKMKKVSELPCDVKLSCTAFLGTFQNYARLK